MKKELIAVGKTVEAAVSNGVRELGADLSRVSYEILEAPKKGFLGFGEAPAKVKIVYTTGPEDAAMEFLRTLLNDMGISAEIEMTRDTTGGCDRVIRITGEEAGVLIGHHGDTMEALQCLTNIAANRRDEEEDGEGRQPYVRIAVDIERYREKREETLRRLARSMASKVQKSRKSITLEPMNPYERRIIHSEIQNIRGVSTRSVGVDENRKIVVFPEETAPRRPRRPRPEAAAQPAEEETKTESEN